MTFACASGFNPLLDAIANCSSTYWRQMIFHTNASLGILSILTDFTRMAGTIMPEKAAKVRITERQQKILNEFACSKTEPLFLKQRAQIILLAYEGYYNEDIEKLVHLERHQVGR